MKSRRIEIRVTELELDEWVRQSRSHATTLSEWIRYKCNVPVVTQYMAPLHMQDSTRDNDPYVEVSNGR